MNSFSSGPRLVRSSTWKLARLSSISAKSAMLVGPNFWVKVALLLLISPGITTSAGPCLAAFWYSIAWYIALSAFAFAFSEVAVPAVGDALWKVGCAIAAPHAHSTAAENAPCLNRFMSASPLDFQPLPLRARLPGAYFLAFAGAATSALRQYSL